MVGSIGQIAKRLDTDAADVAISPEKRVLLSRGTRNRGTVIPYGDIVRCFVPIEQRIPHRPATLLNVDAGRLIARDTKMRYHQRGGKIAILFIRHIAKDGAGRPTDAAAHRGVGWPCHAIGTD